ncbi:MAG: glycoside hydrolase family 3 N-terminal domain-containing protein [Oligoflexales bacterium]
MNEIAAQVVSGALSTTKISRDERHFLERWQPAGLTLFRRNFTECENNVLELNLDIQGCYHSSHPALISIDQEGGRVRRLRTVVTDPGAPLHIEERSTSPSALQRIQEQQYHVGQQLKQLGVNVNFAPVLDIWSHDTHTAIGDRCWGEDSDHVTRRAKAALIGLKKAGLATCLKHFPGQGKALFDTHMKGAQIELNRGELEEHLQPFRAMTHLADMVMISHASYRAFGSTEACFNPYILNHLLKSQLHFQGVVVSDDLTMGAIDQQSRGEVGVAAIAAGCDLLLVCEGLEHWQNLCEAISKEAAKSPVFSARLHDAASKVKLLRRKFT